MPKPARNLDGHHVEANTTIDTDVAASYICGMIQAVNPTVVDTLQQKLRELLDRKVKNEKRKAEAVSEDLAIDRDMADLRAASRVLEIELPFPEPEEKEKTWGTLDGRQRLFSFKHTILASPPAPKVTEGKGDSPPPPAPRPPVKDIVLDCLTTAGDKGMGAAQIRAHIDRVYGGGIHKKTVGMTLYRLSKDGYVTRDGNTWFLGQPPKAAKENPGGETPGPIEDLLK